MRRVRFSRRCRDLGFTLDQARDLLRPASQKDEDCAEVDRITAQHLIEIENKISDLNRLAKELRRLNNCCQGKGIIEVLSASAKPIAEALSQRVPFET